MSEKYLRTRKYNFVQKKKLRSIINCNHFERKNNYCVWLPSWDESKLKILKEINKDTKWGLLCEVDLTWHLAAFMRLCLMRKIARGRWSCTFLSLLLQEKWNKRLSISLTNMSRCLFSVIYTILFAQSY